MRRSLRFFSSCSSSSLIFIGISFLPFIKQEVIAGDAAQDHAFEPVQVVETITGGFGDGREHGDRKSTRLNSSHGYISYAVFCLKKKKKQQSSLYTRSHD